jgi:hypothetical protein
VRSKILRDVFVGCASALAVLAVIGLPGKATTASKPTSVVTTPTGVKQPSGSGAQLIRDDCHLR